MNQRKISFIPVLFLIIGLFSCNDAGNSSTESRIEFKNTEFDFGNIPYKAEATYEFTFTNTGKKPLIITNVKSSCGCTVPSYPAEPVKPGESASISVRYDSKRIGVFSKSVEVYTNGKNSPVKLRIKGEVKEEGSKENDITDKN